MKKAVALVMAVAATAALALPASAAELAQSLVVTPGKGVSFYMGTKHGIAHFQPESGGCKLTVAMAEKPAQDGMAGSAGARMIMSVVPGKPASFQTESGETLVFACNPDLQSMHFAMPPGAKFTAQ